MPYLYVVARTERGEPVVLAGTWLITAAQLSPDMEDSWGVDAVRGGSDACLAGRTCGAGNWRAAGRRAGTAHWRECDALARLAGVITAGGDEDDQIFAPPRRGAESGGIARTISVDSSCECRDRRRKYRRLRTQIECRCAAISRAADPADCRERKERLPGVCNC